MVSNSDNRKHKYLSTIFYTMPTQTSVLAIPKFRLYAGEKPFYLAKGVVTEDGKPKVSVTRWDADYVLRQVEKTAGLPSLYESHIAAAQDPELRQSIFSLPAEWQRTLILNPNAPTDTPEYVLMDADRNQAVLQPSDTPRSLNPVKVHKEGERNIVVANVFDIHFPLRNGRYNPEDLDQKTGFPKQLDPKGRYLIWFGSDSRLYASLLGWDGNVIWDWGPAGSNECVGFRGASTENLPAELLDVEEHEIDVGEEKDTRQIILDRIDRLEAGYSGDTERTLKEIADLRKLL